MRTVSEEERGARALLARIAEPGEPKLGAVLARWGAVEVLERIAAGSVEVPGSAQLRIRLQGSSGAQELARGVAAGARYLCPGELDWPTQLDDLDHARPFGLWVRGDLDLRPALLRSVSIVGARAATAYGTHVGAGFASALAQDGWSVVSGCALGIDAAAHRGALGADGITLGVLAGGVDQPYPPSNGALIARIAETGLLLSEAPIGAPPVRPRFLTRTRVIAALTRGTVVVEAAVRSGAGTTARWADQLGRVLMAVPGPITSAMSIGSNELLRSSHAVAVTRPAEVIEAVGALGSDLAPERARPSRPRDALAAPAREVLEALPARRAMSVSELVGEVGLSVPAISAALGELAALALVERVDGGWRLARAERRAAG
ncbi:MAG: DNA-processing protein DprA [Sporichthyaceae bacterium]